MMLGIYFALNLGAHFDIDRRQGLRIGAGLGESLRPRRIHEQIPA